MAPQARLHAVDLTEPCAGLTTLIDDFESTAQVVTTVGTTFYLVTDYQAERKRLVAVVADDPARERWREVGAGAGDTLLDARDYGGRLACPHLRNAHSALRVRALDGD